jgi:succinoglycan biosynthesis transport protein ExoP
MDVKGGIMETMRYFYPLRRWWWLVTVSTLVAAVLSFLYISHQPRIYQTHTTLMIGTTINDPNPTYNDFALGQQLAEAYANIANRQIIHDATLTALGLNQLPDYNAHALPNTQLIEIAVNDTDPNRAQAVANELANQLVLRSPTSAQPEEQGRQDFINQRLNVLETQINETEDEIKQLQENLGNMISAQQIDETQGQISSLQSKLSDMQNNYGTLLSNTHQGAVNSLTIIEPAGVPSTPIGPRVGVTVLLAAAFGFVLAVGEAYLLGYLDDTLKTSNDVVRMFSAPVIGHIFEQKNGSNEKHLFDATELHNPLAEAFRVLRTNIELSNVNRPLKTILVTSADIGDGKTFVAANLALFIAQRRKRVVLLDADLRRPTIHEYFDMDNDKGLVDLFSNRATIKEVLKIREDRKFAVITAGVDSPNPAELLSSSKMDRLLTKLSTVADVVVIDSSPFIIADAMILASKVDGVLMVVRPGHTRQSLAQVAFEQMGQVGARVIGVVLNRIPLRDAGYYAGKGYLYTHHMSDYGADRENGKVDE